MIKKYNIGVTIVFLTLSSFVFGQTNKNGQDPLPNDHLKRKQKIAKESKGGSNRVTSIFRRPNSNPDSPSPVRRNRNKNDLPTITKKQKEALDPDPRIVIKYADFLKNKKKTGLLKSFLQGKSSNKNVVSVNDLKEENRSPFYGAGRLYYANTYQVGLLNLRWLSYQEDKLVINDYEKIYGLITSLDENILETIDKKNSDVVALKKYKIPRNSTDISKNKLELEDGIDLNGKIYKSSVKPELNTTYLIRLITYDLLARSIYGFKNKLAIDVIVAFRIEKIEPNQAVTILWKRLHKKDSPSLRN